jgi:hypothetical protein
MYKNRCQNQKIELQVPILSETQLTIDESQSSEHKNLIDLLSMDPYDFPVS